jgi:hypothetical protein
VSVPGLNGKRGIDREALTVQRDREIPVHVDEPIRRNDVGDRLAEQLLRSLPIKAVSAVDDLRFGLGEALRQRASLTARSSGRGE